MMTDGEMPAGEPVEIFDPQGRPVGHGELRDGALVLNNRVVPPERIERLNSRGVYLKPNVRLGEYSDDAMPQSHQGEVTDRLA